MKENQALGKKPPERQFYCIGIMDELSKQKLIAPIINVEDYYKKALLEAAQELEKISKNLLCYCDEIWQDNRHRKVCSSCRARFALQSLSEQCIVSAGKEVKKT